MKNENYFGSKLNELVHYTCKKDMVVNNIDMIFRYYKDKNKLRVVESKHLSESIKKGQKNILEQLTGHSIESFVVFGNPPYDNNSFIYSLHTYNLYRVDKATLVSFFNNEIQEEGLIEFLMRKDKKLIKLNRKDYNITASNYNTSNTPDDGFAGLIPPDAVLMPTESKETKRNYNDEFQEKDIVRILMLYGNQTFQIHQNKETEEWNVATYVLSNMEEVIEEFEHPLYRKIVNMIYEELAEERILTNKNFLNHEDKEIQALAINLSTLPCEYSENWLVKFDKPLATQPMSDGNFKTDVITGINLFKLKKIQRLYEKNQCRLKNVPKDNFEELMRLLKMQKRLMEIRSELAELTGTHVLK